MHWAAFHTQLAQTSKYCKAIKLLHSAKLLVKDQTVQITQRGRQQTQVSIFRVRSPIGGLRSSRRDSGSEFKPLKVSLQQRSLHVICSRLTSGRPPATVSESWVFFFLPKPEIRGNFWFSVAAKLRVG